MEVGKLVFTAYPGGLPKRTQTQNKSFNMKPFGKSLRKKKPQKKQSKSKHFLVETK